MSAVVNVRVDEAEKQEWIRLGVNLSEAARAGIEAEARRLRSAALDRQMADGYASAPLTADEQALIDWRSDRGQATADELAAWDWDSADW